MRRHRWTKWLVIFFLPVAVWVLASNPGWAKYPDRPITFIMPQPAGGGTDICLRPLVSAASKNIGQPIVMEYHPGGSQSVGLGILKTKKPDGYTIAMATVSSLISQHMRKVTYDFWNDFSIIMQYSEYVAGFVVRADAPWKTFKEFMEYAKANPGKLRYSSAGPGGAMHLAIAYVAAEQHVNVIHIPYEGGPRALAAVLGGHVEAYSTTMHAKPHIVAGRLRLLTIYGEKRSPQFPNVPTLTELGYTDVFANSPIILGLKNLSSEIIETLDQAFKNAMQDPDFHKACGMVDQIVTYRNSQDATKHYQKLDEQLGKLVRDLKLRKQ